MHVHNFMGQFFGVRAESNRNQVIHLQSIGITSRMVGVKIFQHVYKLICQRKLSV